MKFQKDVKFLITKIILLALVIFWIFFFGNKILKKTSVIELAETELTLIMLLVFLVVNYFMVYSVELKEDLLIVKNLYGLKIREWNLNAPFKRKINQRSPTYKGEIILTLLGKKYSNLIDIKFTSQKRKLYINGHIFSKRGLKDFISKTKK